MNPKNTKMQTDISTLIIIVGTVIFSFKGFKDKFFFNKYKFQTKAIQDGEKIRMISSGFLHADQIHLIFNMLTLYFFAGHVIHYVGKINFVLIYFGSLLIGNFVTLFFHKREPYYSAIGASGAVMGILYSAILLDPSIQLAFFGIIPIPGFIFAIGYLLYSIYGMKNSVGNIGHSAHLGGAVGGYVLTILLYPNVLETSKIMILILAIPIVLVYLFRDRLNP